MNETAYCEKCKKVLDVKNFYGTNNLEKYPDGRLHQCKKCITMHVDNWDPDTYLWILQEADVPYIPDEWDKLMASYARDKSKLSGATIVGRYLGKMRLRQWREYRWKDTDFLREQATYKIEQAMKQRGYDRQAIDQAINKVDFQVPDGPLEIPVYDDNPALFGEVDQSYSAPFPAREEEFDDIDLTEEDTVYLRLKWGKNYRPSEWVQLEQLYNEMMQSYDIQQAGDINTLKLACKCSLKANTLLDLGDIDGAQKSTKMYNDLMKSGKWTAAQNKDDKGEEIDTISELVLMCEKQGFIPKYYTEGPQDKIDYILKDMQKYTHDLVMNETNLGYLIENAAKQMAEEQERIAAAASDTRSEEEKLFEDFEDTPITDEDYAEFADLIESEHQFDLENIV